MNWDPELLRALSYNWLTKMSEMIHLHSAHTIFHSRRGHLKTQASKLLAARASPSSPRPHWGSLQRSVRPPRELVGRELAGPSQNTTPTLSHLGFELLALRASQLRTPNLLLNQGPHNLAMPLNRLIINSQEYSNLTHSTAGLFCLDPLGEMPQSTGCTLTRKWTPSFSRNSLKCCCIGAHF